MEKISSKEALCYLVLARQSEGYSNLDEEFKKLLLKGDDFLKTNSELESDLKRFNQCFADDNTRHFLSEIDVNKLYNKYFFKRGDKWSEGYLVSFAQKFYKDPKVTRITITLNTPPIFVIKEEENDKFYILDGMHRATKTIKDGKSKIKAVIIVVKKDI